MSRVKISEFKAKNIIYGAFNFDYFGLSIDLSKNVWAKELKALNNKDFYVVKVDQAIKKRNKLGLVFVKRTKTQVTKDLLGLKKKGFDWALVENFVEHEKNEEKFIALLRTKEGIQLAYSEKGGVDVEENKEKLHNCVLDHFFFNSKDNLTSLNSAILQKLHKVFLDAHMTYLEINPALIERDNFIPLDAAVEVDSAALFFVDGVWGKEDVRSSSKLSIFEKRVEELNDNSPASFNLKMLNKDASVFLLLSGGGASVVVADELAAQGLHNEIANYGEYSGNPNEEETYTYTIELLKLLLDSKAKNKVLIIGGGIASFTDVAKTFKGIIRALESNGDKLSEQKVSVFVRRGGPNYQIGLDAIKECLEEVGLKHKVFGPDIAIAHMVREAANEVKNV